LVVRAIRDSREWPGPWDGVRIDETEVRERRRKRGERPLQDQTADGDAELVEHGGWCGERQANWFGLV
jgi:hypothetical protein